MPAFTYTARALNGDLRTATIDAPSRDEVVAQLRRQRLNVVKIDEAAQAANKKKSGGKISMRDVVIFTRQFSTMINAGLPLVQALDILAQAEREQGAQGRHARRRVRRRVGPHRRRRAAQASEGVHGPLRQHGRRR